MDKLTPNPSDSSALQFSFLLYYYERAAVVLILFDQDEEFLPLVLLSAFRTHLSVRRPLSFDSSVWLPRSSYTIFYLPIPRSCSQLSFNVLPFGYLFLKIFFLRFSQSSPQNYGWSTRLVYALFAPAHFVVCLIVRHVPQRSYCYTAPSSRISTSWVFCPKFPHRLLYLTPAI